jgi:hypothetical protein
MYGKRRKGVRASHGDSHSDSGIILLKRVMLGRSIFSEIHPEIVVLHGTLVITIITSVPWRSTISGILLKRPKGMISDSVIFKTAQSPPIRTVSFWS